MNATSIYFVGGCRHGEWLTVDDRMAHVEVPHVAAVDFGDPLDPFPSPTAPLRRDLYRVTRFVLTEQHPCVRGAGLARLYRAAVWDGMPPDAQPPVRELVEHGHVDQQRRLDLPHPGDAPWWWVTPFNLPSGRWVVTL